MIKTLASLGCNFDCASKGELELVLGLGVQPERIIYANPCKQISGLNYAREHGVNLMTFDSAGELEKIKKFFPDAKLVIRFAADDSYSKLPLGTKFGAHPNECVELLKMAMELNLAVVGISFHVGSACSSELAYGSALTLARKIFDDAKQLGIDIELVDIGGGFSGYNTALFQRCADLIRQKLDELFGVFPNVRFIGEPGRYFASTPHTLALNVIAKRAIKQEDHIHYNYYLGDGVYGSLNSFLFAQSTKPEVHLANPCHRPSTSCTLFGPTCDSLDVIYNDIQLPELNVGEWVYFLNYGAYTVGTHFTNLVSLFICYQLVEALSMELPHPKSITFSENSMNVYDSSTTALSSSNPLK
jgi:ornithine decarboxylase